MRALVGGEAPREAQAPRRTVGQRAHLLDVQTGLEQGRIRAGAGEALRHERRDVGHDSVAPAKASGTGTSPAASRSALRCSASDAASCSTSTRSSGSASCGSASV